MSAKVTKNINLKIETEVIKGAITKDELVDALSNLTSGVMSGMIATGIESFRCVYCGAISWWPNEKHINHASDCPILIGRELVQTIETRKRKRATKCK